MALEDRVQVGGDKSLVGTDAVDEPTVLAPHVDDQGLAGGQTRSVLRAVSTLCALSVSSREPAEDVVADPGADRGRDPQPGEVDRRVGAAPPMFKTSSSTAISSPALGK